MVLPLLLENVALPGFLKGKFYGDFTDDKKYEEVFSLLIRKLGRTIPAAATHDELEELRDEVAAAKEVAAHYAAQLDGHKKLALRGKSPELITKIDEANKKFPHHAVINTTHAFQASGAPVMLDYLLWAIAKSHRKVAHPLEVLISMDHKWPEVEAMLDAYDDLLGK